MEMLLATAFCLLIFGQVFSQLPQNERFPILAGLIVLVFVSKWINENVTANGVSQLQYIIPILFVGFLIYRSHKK